jgi:hypothetical protein
MEWGNVDINLKRGRKGTDVKISKDAKGFLPGH